VTVNEIFESQIPQRIANQPDTADEMNGAIYQFNVTGDGAGDWFVDFAASPPVVGAGQHDEAKCTVTLAGEDLLAIVGGQLNPQMAFMGGKLKINGDMALALKLSQILSQNV